MTSAEETQVPHEIGVEVNFLFEWRTIFDNDAK